MTVGSLFSGIGGFDLGFERAGYDVRWQVEIDDYANRVLAKHWPNVRRYRDIRTIDWRDVEPVDVVCGGFPCQPHSVAGRRKASEDDRDLWPEVVRCLRETQPRWFVGENVTGLLSSENGRFFGTVLRDLAACGFDAEWSTVSACSVGMPHMRQRLFIVAYANSEHGRPRFRDSIARALRPLQEIDSFARARTGYETRLANPSELYRNADGVPFGMERNRGIGNAVAPDVAEWIARRILEADQAAA